MSLVGGFLGGYALLNRCATFGSSETSNMIYLITELLGRNWHDWFIRLIALLIYIAGLELTIIIPKYSRVNMRILAVIVDAAGIIITTLLPSDMNFIIALYPIFFITAFQWNVFEEADGYKSATIFSTNNLRQTTLSYGNYILKKDPKDLKKAIYFTFTLLYYHLGVVYAYFSSEMWGTKGALACILPLAAAMYLVIKHDYIIKNKNSIKNITAV